MPTEAQVSDKLTAALKPAHLEVSDFSDGCGAKFNVVVVSDEFEGKPLLDRHRMVNTALAEEMSTIHAITMKTYTPTQWETIKAKQAAN